MATEQDWAAYTDQAYLATTDTLLARTGGGAGVEIAGSHLFARRAASGPYKAEGDILVSGKIRINGSSEYDSSDYWGTGGNNPLFTPYGFLGSNGSFSLSLYSNGYRNLSSGFTYMGINGNTTTAAGIDINYDGSLEFRGGAASGTTLPLRLKIEAGGHTRPGADNIYTSATASYRWSIVYAASGTINTSDAREKAWLAWNEDRRVVDRRIARRIFDEMGWFQWNDALAEKGADGARWHFGARAQRIWTIVAEEGLCAPLAGEGDDALPDPDWQGQPPPAWLCFDAWDAEIEQRPVTSSTLLNEQGEPLQIGMETVTVREAGNRFGLRMDQLGALLDWSLHERLAALEVA